MGPTVCAPAINNLILDFNIKSTTISTLSVTIYLLGLATGPMFMSPLSEIYGRIPIYHTASLAFVSFLVGNALSKNIAQFMVFRFLSGCAGGIPMALGGGTIADVTRIEKRGMAMALFSLGPLTGPVSYNRFPSNLSLTHLFQGSWSCNWGFYHRRERLAMDILGDGHRRRNLWSRGPCYHARNSPCNST